MKGLSLKLIQDLSFPNNFDIEKQQIEEYKAKRQDL